MNSVVTQRFLECLKKLKADSQVRSSRQFAMALDYLPQSLSEISQGRRDVTIELIRKAVAKYQFNPVYLYTGEGPFFMTEQDHKNFRVLTIVTSGQEDERIVHVPVPAQAGYAGQMSNPTFIQELPTYSLPDYKYKVGTHRSFDVSGDSMEPTLFEGDKVICSYLEPTLWETAIKDNYVYVIVTRGDVLVKRVINHIKGSNQLELRSDNDFYEPYIVNMADLKEIWYVRAKISPFLPSPQNIQNNLHREINQLKDSLTQQSQLIQTLQLTVEKMSDKIGN